MEMKTMQAAVQAEVQVVAEAEKAQPEQLRAQEATVTQAL